jgi:ABC-type Fe3+-hydroxamate transport system substrate-binding protein
MLDRRRFLTGSLGVTALAALGACASSSSSSGGPAGSSTSSGGPDFPRVVRHEQGRTELAARPERVVCGSDGSELCSVLALGVQPVGFGQRNDPLQPWLGDLADGIDTYDLSSGETSYERLAAWAPDLILVQNGFATPETMPRFTDVAPTVATSFIDWRANLRQVAKALALEDRAREIEAEKDGAIAAAAERLAPRLGQRSSPLRLRGVSAFSDGSVYVLNDDSPLGKLAEALGLEPFPAAKADGEAVDQLSLERLDELEADLLLVLTFDDPKGIEQLRDREVFQRLDVVRDRRVLDVAQVDADQLYFDAVLTVEPNIALIEQYADTALA